MKRLFAGWLSLLLCATVTQAQSPLFGETAPPPRPLPVGTTTASQELLAQPRTIAPASQGVIATVFCDDDDDGCCIVDACCHHRTLWNHVCDLWSSITAPFHSRSCHACCRTCAPATPPLYSYFLPAGCGCGR